MPDAIDIKAGSSSLVLGCDSYTNPTELGDKEFIMGQNVTCRGGKLQTRPGSRSLFCVPDGNFQGGTLFTAANGVAQIVFAVDGSVYVSTAPFATYRQLTSLQFSTTAKYIAWETCLKSTDFDNEGLLIPVANPYSVLIIQDGLTRAAYYDGGTAAHMNPGSPPPPNEADVVPGYNETPIGLWMKWIGNRLWVSRGNLVFASDIGNPLKFTEALYLNEGRAFYLSGPCTGMVATPDQQGLIAFTETDGTFFKAYIQDRTKWLTTDEFQKVILPNVGCIAPRSIVIQYGLIWWFSAKGLTNFDAALRNNITSAIDYKDNEMFASKAYLGPDLSGICGSFYENYLMTSVPSADVLNRHTWVLDQAPMEDVGPVWTGIWTGWRPLEWMRGSVGGSERIFLCSIDYDGKNRIWEAMLPDRTDNGCRITCYAQLRDHAAGTLDPKQYDWSKFFLSEIYGDVDLNCYVASTKGSYQFQKNYRIVASEGQIFSETEYSETGPYMMGNSVQSRTIRTPSGPEDNACNACGVESVEGNTIDYAFSHLLVWSGQMGIRAYQLYMRDSPERKDGDCEVDEVAPRTLNAQGCSGMDLFVDGEVFEEFTAYAEGSVITLSGAVAYIRRTYVSQISAEHAQAMADCAVQQIIAYLMDQSPAPGVYETLEAQVGSASYLVVNSLKDVAPKVDVSYVSSAAVPALIGYDEYASPSVPPKRYLVQTIGGSWCNRDRIGSCAGLGGGQDREVYSGNYAYNPVTSAQTNNQVNQYGFVIYTTILPCNQPPLTASGTPPRNFAPTVNSFGHFVLTETPTSRDWTYDGICDLTHFRTVTGTVTANLSTEDTESNAINRAVFTPGASGIAYRQQRGAGQFSFDYATASISFSCHNLGLAKTYRVTLGILEEDYGGGSSVLVERHYVFVATGDTHNISDSLVAPTGKQYTAQAVSIEEVE